MTTLTRVINEIKASLADINCKLVFDKSCKEVSEEIVKKVMN